MRAAAGVVAAIALVGCSAAGAGQSPSGAPASNPAASSDGPVPEVDVQDAGAKPPAPTVGVPVEGSPLNQYLPAFGRLAEASVGLGADVLKERSDTIQAEIAACMIDEGFEYVPVEYTPVEPSWAISATSIMPIPLLPDGRADAERFGYGVDPGETDWGPTESPTSQKNIEIYDALSDSEAEAYDKALFGGYQATEEELASSCAGKANAAHPELDLPAPPESEFADLQNAVADVWNVDVPADERTVALNEAWEACVAKAGIDLVMDNREIPGPDPLTAYWQAVGTGADGVMDEKDRDRPSDEIPLDRKLIVGAAPEIAIAVADFDCRAEVDYDATRSAIQQEHEEKFVVANQKDLDRLLAAVDELKN